VILARTILRAARLCAAIHSMWIREVPIERACSASMAIVLASDDHASPELLAAIAYGESRFVVGAVNRRTKVCGPMQVKASRATCRRIVAGDELLGYRVAVEKLNQARAWCIRRRTPGSLCTLAVYRSGPRGARDRLYRGPRAVIARRDAFRRAVVRMQPRPELEGGGA
jgi:hypothetical protein